MSIELQEFKCPLCQKKLASEEYQKAVEELRKKVALTYDEQTKKINQEHQQQLQEIAQTHKAEIEQLKIGFDEQRKTLRKQGTTRRFMKRIML